MKRNACNYSHSQRLGALLLAIMMVVSILPANAVADGNSGAVIGEVTTVADPSTLSRPVTLYGDNTENAGKVTVGKSVSDSAITLNYGTNSQTFTPAENNFMVTVSQAAQVMGLTSQSTVPVDVVFVLDTSGSMSGSVSAMVSAANNAIKTLLSTNDNNRISVVAFSGTSGGGTSEGAAANVLSPLAHYDGQGETAHLTYSGGYISGRGMSGSTRLNRNGTSQGTNIHAGVVVGAQQLMNATDVTVTIDGKQVTRIPFLVIMSDGQPSYAASGAQWYAPNVKSQLGNLTNQSGVGFLPALTAAYYKGAITEKYFGANATKDNRCFVYTMGMGLQNLSSSDQHLALMTVDPAGQTSSNNQYATFEEYWNAYKAGNSFNVRVSGSYNNNTYTISKESIAYTKNNVNGLHSVTGASLGYTGGYKYNDDYFNANQASDLATAFNNIVISIQEKALTAPTHVDVNYGDDFSGYVTFTDPIGEYMEVKDMKGILANGNWYRGQSFARNMDNWTDASQDFKDHVTKVLKERCEITGISIDVDAFISQAVASSNQLYYNSPTDYDNSLVWWGRSFLVTGEEDPHIQYLGFADNDTIEYITDANTVIPEDADYVCRSYYFYGAAGETATNPDHEMLHFVVRVQRSVRAPYQQSVVISCPASLLSMEQVLVMEDSSNTLRVKVTEADPARVVYEVGLRSDINAFNVDQIVGTDTAYVNEQTTDTQVKTNYDAETGVYTFYTNDWHRDESESSHHRAMAKATFDAAVDNSFYTFTEDTQIYIRNGSNYVAYTGSAKPMGSGYYYAQTVYDWSGKTQNADGTYNAVEKTLYHSVSLPDSSEVQQIDGKWMIRKGVYKSFCLSGNEDLLKETNATQTATAMVHPHRTEEENNSHYTVLLGNNGKLTLKKIGDTKKVDVTKSDGTQILDANGKTVMVGDVLTYTVQVVNPVAEAAKATATDTIPVGTEYIAGSVSHNGVYDEATGKITWTDLSVPANSMVEVSFQVKVTEAALSGEMDVVTIDNTAYVSLDNSFTYTTNTTKNPPEGKKVVDTDGAAIAGGVQVSDVLVYRIRWQNDAVDAQGKPTVASKITVTDFIPAGTSYVPNSADHNGVYDAANQKITWTFMNVPAGASGMISFRVSVDADAVEYIQNDAKIQIGDNDPHQTNNTKLPVLTGDLFISKNVADEGKYPNAVSKTFTVHVTEVGLDLDGVYGLTRNGTADPAGITFQKGVATLQIRDDELVEIHGIPAGAVLSVTEVAMPGFTPSYLANGVTSASEGRITVAADNNQTVEITNTYNPMAIPFQLKGKKVLDTGVAVGETTFGFVAEACDATGTVLTGAAASELTGEVKVSSDTKEAVITFSPVTFTEINTYHYLISEINGGVTGVTYAKNQYLLNIVVSDDGSGQLKAEATITGRNGTSGEFTAVGNGAYNDTAVTFTNVYEPLETQLNLHATKVLTGRMMKAEEFSFAVQEGTKEVATGTNDASGKVTFKPITYTTPGTHTYTVYEVDSNLHGVTYSGTTYTIVVKVEDKAGQLQATVASVNGTATTDSYDLTFQNTYEPDKVRLVLEGTKTLINKSGDDSIQLQDKQFSFVVKEGTETVATGHNDATGKIHFSPITYDIQDLGGAASKTFTYKVSELVPDALAKDPNMDYDAMEYTVQVTVSYDSVTGKLSVGTPVITGGSGLDFVNTLYPNTVSIAPQGFKHTYTDLAAKTGAEQVPSSVSFSFRVVDENGNVDAVGVGSANPADPAVPNVTFSQLTYGNADVGKTYTYTIREAHTGTVNGIVHDPVVYEMKVTVNRSEAGELSASVKYYREGVELTELPTFENEYGAKGYLNLHAIKKLNDSTELGAKVFAFRMQEIDSNNHPVGLLFDGISDANGKVDFGTLYYDLDRFAVDETEKTIRYQITELEPAAGAYPGVTYDETVYIVTVKLVHDEMGNITATVQSIQDHDGNTVTEAVFNNTYTPVTGTTAVIEAEKELTGRDLAEDEFSFLLYHVADGVETLVDTATNDAEGKVVFTRAYPATVQPGTYDYVIREMDNELGGVTYDDNNGGVGYKVQVTITDEGHGVLHSVVTYPDGAVTFHNSYKTKDTAYTPAATKVLKNRALLNEEFSFLVKDKDGKVVSTGMNDATGKIHFTPIGYAEVGTHVYTVSEIVGNLPGMTYTTDVYTLTVTVADNGDGTMSATGKYELAGVETEPVFTNVYSPDAVSVQLQATKTLVGRDMTEGEFSFLVKDSDGNTVATGGNAAAKSGESAAVNFSHIGFSLDMLAGADTKDFIYTISELATTQGGVTFSQNIYYAKVTLSKDTVSGALQTEVAYFTDAACTTPIGQPSFINTYHVGKAVLQIPTDKTLINKVLAAGEFTFTLKEGEKVLQTKTNDANGLVAFDALEFATPGTYVYTVSEAVSSGLDASRYTLDHSFAVVVTVTDDLKGNLHAAATYHEIDDAGKYDSEVNLGGVEFINYYTAPDLTVSLTQQIGATKTVETPEGITYSPAGFRFAVTDLTGNILKGKDAEGNAVDIIGISDADGKIAFPDFYFEKAGEYHYWIHELDTDKGGILVDARTWELHILVRYHHETGLLYVADSDVQTYLNEGSASGVPAFVNKYDPADATLYLTATKLLEGRELKDREFLFKLMEGDRIAAEAYNDVNGQVKFTLHYTEADLGTHTYTILEHQGNVAGVTYDTVEYAAVTVTVSDNGQGQLIAAVDGKTIDNGATASTGVTVINTYLTADTVAVVKANKVLTGKNLTAGEYTFQLVNTQNEQDVHTAHNAADGAVEFQIGCTEVGVTTYTLREVKGNDANTTYDESTYTVTVTVTDDQAGNLIAQVTYHTADGEVPVFHNTYTPEPPPTEPTEPPTEPTEPPTEPTEPPTEPTEPPTEPTEPPTEPTEPPTEPTEPPTTEPTEPSTVPGNPDVPDTGDSSNIPMYMVLMVVSMGCCIVLLLLLKKKAEKRA